ncbi:MAG: glycosyltransferase family 2 protein [Fimbriimonadaceae bacterium]
MSADVEFIVPVFNDTRFLESSLDSVLAQRGVRARAILVDDGSEALDAAARFGEHPAVARAVRIGHAGVSAARNAGLRLAESPVVGLLDADDLLEPDFCFRLMGELEREDADLAYCDYDRFVETETGARVVRYSVDQGLEAADPLERIVQANLPTGTYLLRAEVARAAGSFRESIRHGEDWEWLMRVAEASRRWVHVKGTLFHYRETEGSASGDFEQMYVQPGRILRAFLDRHGSERLERLSQRFWRNRKLTAASRIRRCLLESAAKGQATRALGRVACFLLRHPEVAPYLLRRFPKP